MKLSTPVAAVALTIALTSSADAQLGPIPVFDASNFAKNMASAANTGATLLKTSQLVLDDIQHLKNEALNLQVAPATIKPQLNADLTQLGQILDVSQNTSFQSGTYALSFSKAFTNYQPGINFTDAYSTWSTNTQNAALAALQAAGYTANGDATMTANLHALAARTDSSQGALSALQVGNNISLQLAEQLAKLRTLQEAQIQSESAYYLNYERTSAGAEHQASRQDLDSWFALSSKYVRSGQQ